MFLLQIKDAVHSVLMKLIKALLNPFDLDIKILSLSFKDRVTEKEFDLDYKSKNEAFVTIFTILGTCMLGGFYMINDTSHPVWFIVMFFLTLVFGIILTFNIANRIYFFSISVFSAIVTISYLLRMLYYKGSDKQGLSEYLFGLILILIVTNLFLRLKYRDSLILNFLYFLIFLYNSIFNVGINQYDQIFFYYSNLIFLSVLITISIALYNFEYSYRYSFIKERIIK